MSRVGEAAVEVGVEAIEMLVVGQGGRGVEGAGRSLLCRFALLMAQQRRP